MTALVDFSTSQRILFGPDCLSRMNDWVGDMGRNALFLQKRGLQAGETIKLILTEKKIECLEAIIQGEPDVDTINAVVRQASDANCDFVIALGGGSVLDSGKAVSAMLTNPGGLMDYLEVVGAGKPITKKALPFIAIPTTAGTGSEVTKNAVISVPQKKVKVSMRHNYLLPQVALVDPELTCSLPQEVTAYSGMDALTQVIEPYLSNRHNSMVDMFCRDAIPKAGCYLKRAFDNRDDPEARLNMSWVSLMGGLSLANAGLGAVHGLAGPIGGMFDLPHGLICAALLASAMKVNYQVIRSRDSQNPILPRFEEISRWLTGRENADVTDGIQWLKRLTSDLRIPRLAQMGVRKESFSEIIEKSRNSSSMKGNPAVLSPEDIHQILELSL